MMKLVEIFTSQAQSANARHRKVRLKGERGNALNRLVSNISSTNSIVYVVICSICIISSVSCMETRNNRPPRFLIDDQHSEIVLRLKEGPDTPVGKLKESQRLETIQLILFINRQPHLQTERVRSRW